MTIFYSIVFFLVAVGILVVWHELGHYFAARACGVKVLRFSVGFGPILWSRTFKGTQWALSAIPLGGYVKLLDEREGNVPQDQLPYAFNRQKLWKRNLILVAGSTANFLLAWVAYSFMFMIGSQVPKPILGDPRPNTLAYEAGVKAADEVEKAGDKIVTDWQQLRWIVLDSVLKKEDLTIIVRDSSGAQVPRTLKFSQFDMKKNWGEGFLDDVGLRLNLPTVTPELAQVLPNTPAEQAGLRAKDLIVSINQKSISDWSEVVRLVQASPDQPLVFEVHRSGQSVLLTVTPTSNQGHGYMGAQAAQPVFTLPMTKVSYSFFSAMLHSTQEMWRAIVVSLNMLGKMILGEASWRNINGPVSIAQYAGASASLGIVPYLNFLAFISLSLGLVNLFPVPMLDGGYLLYNFVEWLRGGRSLSEKTMEFGQKIGIAILSLLMLVAFYNDLRHLV